MSQSQASKSDGLHEDLNRVKQKPYFKTKDSNGSPDEKVAKTSGVSIYQTMIRFRRLMWS